MCGSRLRRVRIRCLQGTNWLIVLRAREGDRAGASPGVSLSSWRTHIRGQVKAMGEKVETVHPGWLAVHLQPVLESPPGQTHCPGAFALSASS